MALDRITTQVNRHGIRIMIPRRRDTPRFDQQPAGVREFTKTANERATAANKARGV